MTANPHIVDSEQLQRISGKQSPAAIRRWARAIGIRVLDGAAGPWTTLEAVNQALGIAPANDAAYRAEDVL